MIYNLLNRLKNEIYIDLYGVKEILLEIAEKTSAKVGSIKKSIDAAALDSEIDKEYEELGKRTYTLIKEDKDPSGDPAIMDSLDRLRQLKLTLLRLEEEMAYFSDKILIGKVLDLKDDLKKGSATLEVITISKDSPFIKIRISDLKLPSDLLIILIKRSDNILIPNGMTELREGDLITIIGCRASIDDAVKSFNGVHGATV